MRCCCLFSFLMSCQIIEMKSNKLIKRFNLMKAFKISTIKHIKNSDRWNNCARSFCIDLNNTNKNVRYCNLSFAIFFVAIDVNSVSRTLNSYIILFDNRFVKAFVKLLNCVRKVDKLKLCQYSLWQKSVLSFLLFD